MFDDDASPPRRLFPDHMVPAFCLAFVHKHRDALQHIRQGLALHLANLLQHRLIDRSVMLQALNIIDQAPVHS